MTVVKVSKKFQVVIPEKLRKETKIRAGDSMLVVVKHGILHYVPIRPLSKTKGFIPGLTTEGVRDEFDRE